MRMRSSNNVNRNRKRCFLEKIEKVRELGVSYLTLYFPDEDRSGLLSDFADQVMSRFRDTG